MSGPAAPDAGPGGLPGPWGALLYDCVTTHVRTRPFRAFRHRGYLWLVDPDHLPPVPRPLRPLARFRTRDHAHAHDAYAYADADAPVHARAHANGAVRDGATIRGDLQRHLAAHGVDLAGGSVLMLTQARSLGHVFNPLTVYWCRDRAGRPLCTVAEVHNTHGARHRYLLHPDAAGNARTAKDFPVSPFLPVDGHYRMRLPEPGARLDLAVHLDLPGGRALTATVRGTGRPAGPGTLLRAALRHPFATWAVTAHIRYQGVRLWLRGLSVHPPGPRRSS